MEEKKVDSVIMVTKEEPTQKAISMSEQSGIEFKVNVKEDGSPTPCKAQIIGIDGTLSPKLGPVDRAHGCVDQYHSENGKFSANRVTPSANTGS